ncbi:MAG: 5-amino-6-(5-phospho-D-ribitylamino)uracil phosphatase, partial [Mycobacterium sp.]|nr:5-amino-6-(5-phospho-D-ribitylamino)uracil phosphatase [Mycobacterium sp.]
MSTPAETGHGPWLVTLDVDGTVLRSDETASAEVIEQVRRLSAAGHQVMLATGRSPATTVPVVEYLGITPQF